MSRDRKLQKEVQLALKKIDEGIDTFDTLYEKVYEAEEKSQKLKHESDLKKEIKKLQRLREQLKTWIQSADLKETAKLTSTRKLIELKMEQFKKCEKEMKTKTYSKVGLAKAALAGDDNGENAETIDWVNEQLEHLRQQVSTVQVNIDTMNGTGSSKKKGKSKKAEVQSEEYHQTIEQHQWHITRLEQILSMLETGEIEAVDVEAIKDDVEYYVTENNEPDFYDDQDIYTSILNEAGSAATRASLEKATPLTDPKSAPATERSTMSNSSFDQGLGNIGRGVSKTKAQATLDRLKSNTPAKQGGSDVPESNPTKNSATDGTLAGNGGSDADSTPEVPPHAKGGPAGIAPSEGQVGSADEQAMLNRMLLRASFAKLPSRQDSTRDPAVAYQPRNPYPTPESFPTAPHPLFESANAAAIFDKFDEDTLFFVFYFQQGTYQQHLAAKQLKSRSWRYHKKYNTWFQRHEEPTVTNNDEYEQGTYKYFDFEAGWCQRIKKDFRFEYKYLEDGN